MEPSEDTFHHPYSPYDIQLQFMRALYACLEQGKVAVFESPTGQYSLVGLALLPLSHSGLT